MRDLAIAREVARATRWLAGLVLLLGGLLVWIFARPESPAMRLPEASALGVADSVPSSAWAWGLVALVPCSLWAGLVAGGPPRPTLFTLARPVGRARMFVARAAGALLPVFGAASVFMVVPIRLDASEASLPLLAVAVASWLAFVAGALGGCAREDEPFALAIGFLLLVIQGAPLVVMFLALGVGVHRPFEGLHAASVPILVATVVVASWPLVDHWRFMLPRRGGGALRRAAVRWLGSTAILVALWTPAALFSGRPAQGKDRALIGIAPGGDAWVATGVRGNPFTESATDGLILLAPDGSRRDVAVWTEAGRIWGLGTQGEVKDLVVSPTGEHVAVLLERPPRVELVGRRGPIGSSSTLASGGFGRGARWSHDGRRFVFLRRGPDGSTLGVLEVSAAGITDASYDLSALEPSGILASCENVLTLGDPRKQRPIAFVEHDLGAESLGRVVGVPVKPGGRPRFGASPSSCRIASADIARGRLEISLFDARDLSVQPRTALELSSSGRDQVLSVVWLDERHVVVDIGSRGRGSLRVVVRDDGTVVARHPILAGTWGIRSAFGPPTGPWILENGIDLRAVAADGTTIWRAELPFLSAEAGPVRPVVDAGRVRWVGHGGRAFDMKAPWVAGADR